MDRDTGYGLVEPIYSWERLGIALPRGEACLYYNSGSYGQERMFCRRSLPSG